MKQLDDDYQLTLFIYSGIAWVVLNLAFLPRRVGFIVDVLLLGVCREYGITILTLSFGLH